MSGRRSPPTQRTGNLLGANSITMVMEMDLTVVINYSNCTIFSYAVTKFSFVYKILTSNQFHHIMVKFPKLIVSQNLLLYSSIKEYQLLQ